MGMSSETPLSILSKSLDEIILVKMKDDRIFRGKLKGFDQHLNLLLEDAEDVSTEETKKLGLVIIRGNNVMIISPSRIR